MRKNQSYISRVLALAFSLAKVNFRLRNEGSYLGVFWYLLSPLILFAVLLFVRENAFGQEAVPFYPLYLIVGLLMYNFFVQTVAASTNLVFENAALIKSVKIPIEAIVVARAMQSVFSHIFEIAIILICMWYFGIGLSALAIYIAVFCIFILFTLGVAFFVATIGAYTNDLRNIWTVISQILFFVTPIFYMPAPDSAIQQLNTWNPLNYFLEGGREMFIFDRFPSAYHWLILVSISIITLAIGIGVFEKNKDDFAELV